MPLAAFATLAGVTLTLDAAWGDPEGVLTLVRVRGDAPVTDLAGAAALGERVARELRARIVATGGSIPLPMESQSRA